MTNIDSETQFLWKILLDIVLLPFTFFAVIFGKKDFKELFKPFKDLFLFVYQAKFTYWMIMSNVFVYIIALFFPQGLLENLVLYPSNILSLKVYTVITAGFLHSGIEHLAFNMLALFIFGRVVERKLGIGKTALVYFMAMIISGVIFSAVHLFLFNENIPGVGASGAIMGLVSAAMLLSPFYITFEALIPLPVMVVGWLTLYADISGLLSATNDGVAHYAHLGGFISIAFIMFILERQDRKELLKGLVVNAVSLVVFALIYIFLILK